MDPRTILNLLVASTMAGNIKTELTQAVVEKNEAGTQATASVTLYIINQSGAPHTQTITETFSL